MVTYDNEQRNEIIQDFRKPETFKAITNIDKMEDEMRREMN